MTVPPVVQWQLLPESSQVSTRMIRELAECRWQAPDNGHRRFANLHGLRRHSPLLCVVGTRIVKRQEGEQLRGKRRAHQRPQGFRAGVFVAGICQSSHAAEPLDQFIFGYVQIRVVPAGACRGFNAGDGTGGGMQVGEFPRFRGGHPPVCLAQLVRRFARPAVVKNQLQASQTTRQHEVDREPRWDAGQQRGELFYAVRRRRGLRLFGHVRVWGLDAVRSVGFQPVTTVLSAPGRWDASATPLACGRGDMPYPGSPRRPWAGFCDAFGVQKTVA